MNISTATRENELKGASHVNKVNIISTPTFKPHEAPSTRPVQGYCSSSVLLRKQRMCFIAISRKHYMRTKT